MKWVVKKRVRFKMMFRYKEGCSSREGCAEIVKAATEDKLYSLFGQPFTETTVAQRQELYSKLHSLLAQEEAFWRQRAKENWLKIGDSNTKYFHQKVARHQRQNGSYGLFDDSGVWHETKGGGLVRWMMFFIG
ncbi:hypothetical protein ACFX15_012563 [Malus domestica]